MLTTALVLAIVSFLVELILAVKIDFIGRWCRKSGLASLVFSVFLAWFISQVLFGASGLIAMIGGLLAAILSWFAYRLWDLGLRLTEWARAVDLTAAIKNLTKRS